MTDPTPAEQACYDTLVALNGPRTQDYPPYPACLLPLAKAATAAVIAALEEES